MVVNLTPSSRKGSSFDHAYLVRGYVTERAQVLHASVLQRSWTGVQLLSKFDCAARPSGRESEAIDLQGIRSRVLIVLSLNMSQLGNSKFPSSVRNFKLKIPSAALLLYCSVVLLLCSSAALLSCAVTFCNSAALQICRSAALLFCSFVNQLVACAA